MGLSNIRGSFFTCSGLRFAKELFPTEEDKKKLGQILHIAGSTVKSWDKYAIHVIEPVVSILGPDARIASLKHMRINNFVSLAVRWESGVLTSFQALGPEITHGDISLTYFAENGHVTKQFDNSFSAFKTSLGHFIESVRSRQRSIAKSETLRCIELLEAGLSE